MLVLVLSIAFWENHTCVMNSFKKAITFALAVWLEVITGFHISCKVVGYDQNVHIKTCTGIFCGQDNPCGLALEDRLVATG